MNSEDIAPPVETKHSRVLGFLKRLWRHGDRDVILEIIIVAMIGWEIHEGNKQYKLLEEMNKNTADTVSAMKDLRQEQSKSLSAMNETFGQAVGAMESQLTILQEEQKEKLREQARKPHLVVSIGDHPVDLNKLTVIDYLPGPDVPPPTLITITVRNTGDAPATNATLTIMSDPPGQFQCDCEIKRFGPDEDWPAQHWDIPFNLQSRVPYKFTLRSPLQFPTITMDFFAHADTIAYQTRLGIVRLRRSPNQ